jgi:hypothetical protein
MEQKPKSQLTFRRLAIGAAIFLSTVVATELTTGVVTGLGFNVRESGEAIGDWIKSGSFETGGIDDDAAARLRVDQEQCEAEINAVGAEFRKADRDWRKCVEDAKQSLLKMWDPQAHCQEQKLVRSAVKAGWESRKASGC